MFNAPKTEVVADECRSAARGCVDCKKEAAASLNEFLEPIRKRREEWKNQKEKIRKILDQGRERARQVASQTLLETMRAMGIRK